MMDLAPIATSPDLLAVEGAFAWWYLDTVDARGNGVVAIWSWGLPFLPGVESAARAGAPVAAALRPSFNLAIYQDNRSDLYLLREYAPDDAAWVDAGDAGGAWRFGRTRIESARVGARRRVRLDVDEAVPGSRHRITGTIEIDGAIPALPTTGEGRSPHRWSPLACPGEARVALDAGASSWRLDGRAYHDHNRSTTPLSRLGIRSWSWGRLAASGHEGAFEQIYYLLEPEAGDAAPLRLLLRCDDDGHARLLPSTPSATHPRRNLWGLSWHGRLELRDAPVPAVTLGAPLDAGPFYLRNPVADPASGARGWAETVVPGRIDADWARPLVRMAVARPEGASMWLPLFSGPRAGRLGRLLSPGGAC